MNTAPATTTQPAWIDILRSAITEPGILSTAYSAFHNYSLGNQLAAMFQCAQRGIEPGPIATFPSWQDKGRMVKKGSKALCLCMPLTMKRKDEASGDEHTFTRFAWKNRWFVMSQTEGEDYAPETVIPSWDRKLALKTLDITEGKFRMLNGNAQGYAKEREIAINPLAVLPHKTTFHEMAHVVLGHTKEIQMNDGDTTPINEMEMEAEGAAFLLTTLLDLPGKAESRGYIQNWAKGSQFTEKMAQRVFSAANKILKAGQPEAQPV